MRNSLVICRDETVYQHIQASLRPDYRVEYLGRFDGGVQSIPRRIYEFIFIDIETLVGGGPPNGQVDFHRLLNPFWVNFPTAEIIVMSTPLMIRQAVEAVKTGASNYLTYPIVPEELTYVTQSVYESKILQSELDYLRDRFWQKESLEVIQTNSSSMQEVFRKVKAVAPTRSTVLLSGETGTGKGVIARLIHSHSHRRDNQFISVHCGAIPDTLLESELFGHEKGAFTGAIKRKLGKFEIASGGTIFLDEIGTVTPSMQIKLLQVLQDRTYQRVGGEQILEADVRIISASNDDLKQLSEKGDFRKDLYYRLNVFPVEIPPLRQRLEDIPLLSEIFLKRLNKMHMKDIHSIHPQVLEAFHHYSWPGNIRELENLMERAYILETTNVLMPHGFPPDLFSCDHQSLTFLPDTSLTLAEARHAVVAGMERQYLHELLTREKGRIKETADAAVITVRQLHKLMTKYELHKEDFKPTRSSKPGETEH